MTPNRKRDAQEIDATMDHSDIRGLATAFHLFLAGLPRSKNWDHPRDARIKTRRGFPSSVLRIALPVRCAACRSAQVSGAPPATVCYDEKGFRRGFLPAERCPR